MSRSISARIYAGFLGIVVAFGAVMGYTVYRSQEVGEQLALINDTYLRLMLICGELNFVQGRLVNRVAERAAGRTTTTLLRHHIKLARQYRRRHVGQARALVRKARALELRQEDDELLARTERGLVELEKAFRADEALFDPLFANRESSAETLARIGENLLRGERKLEGLTRRLRSTLRAQLRKTAVAVEADQRYGVWVGLALVLCALLVSLAVTLQARRTLRPLRTLVDGVRRIGAGDYAGRVAVESKDELGVLAGEFNNMAGQVQEREARLIRSERMAAAGQLASHITHEVRNPLNSISLNTEMLEEELEGAEGSEGRALCRAIREEVDRLTEITEEYLRFARLPKPSLQREDVNELIAGLLSFVGSELAEAGVSVDQQLDPLLPPVECDENQLRQALLNLVRNAGEAMDDVGGGTLTVSTAVVEDGEQVEITVADTGPGIDEADVARVFEPFFSTKERGTGLGLALTHQIVQEHNGTIAVTSRAGEGTTFRLRLGVSR